MNYDVFISYSRKDTEVAEKICFALDKYGISYFIDRKVLAVVWNFLQ
ncbi:MAG: toll/interleukin-1 receptor domain-containing protein [Prevotellaceae bacterium]|nr:toll/interleukin-1 receptor domain-containing protein [Prevotellaceae bacterium]